MKFGCLISIFLMCSQVFGQIESSDVLQRGTISNGGGSVEIESNNQSFIIQQSIGQSSVIGMANLGNAKVLQGFIQPDLLDKILTPDTPAELEADMFPNPFDTHIYLQFDFVPKTNVVVSAYDVMGRVVWSNSYASSDEITIEPTNLNNGYYIFKVECNGMQRVEKILKNK